MLWEGKLRGSVIYVPTSGLATGKCGLYDNKRCLCFCKNANSVWVVRRLSACAAVVTQLEGEACDVTNGH